MALTAEEWPQICFSQHPHGAAGSVLAVPGPVLPGVAGLEETPHSQSFHGIDQAGAQCWAWGCPGCGTSSLLGGITGGS